MKDRHIPESKIALTPVIINDSKRGEAPASKAHSQHCSTCKHNNGVEYRHCNIILKENPKGFQIGVAYTMAIVGCCSWENC